MALNVEGVNWAYKFMLGRLPESDAVIASHIQNYDENSLIQMLTHSQEYRLRNNLDTVVHDFLSFAETEDQGWGTPERVRGKMRIVVVGNCHGRGMAKIMPYLAPDVVSKFYCLTPEFVLSIDKGKADLTFFLEADLILVQSDQAIVTLLGKRIPAVRGKIKQLPTMVFNAFQPDCVHVQHGAYQVPSPIGPYTSALAFYGWQEGIGIDQTLALFADQVYEALGYYDYWDASVRWLTEEWARCDLEIGDHIRNWSQRGCWMHTMNHPKLFVLADVVRAALAREGVLTLPYVEDYIKDDLGSLTAWPVYPEIGKALGMRPEHTSLYFKRGNAAEGLEVEMLGLAEFVRGCFSYFERFKPEELSSSSLTEACRQQLAKLLKHPTKGDGGINLDGKQAGSKTAKQQHHHTALLLENARLAKIVCDEEALDP